MLYVRALLVCVQHGEEIQTLQKRITHLETDLEQAKTQLTETNEKLEDANKNLSNVRTVRLSVATTKKMCGRDARHVMRSSRQFEYNVVIR